MHHDSATGVPAPTMARRLLDEDPTVDATALAAVTDNDLTLEKVTLAIGQDGPGGSVDSNSAPVQMSSSGTFGPVAVGVLARKVTNEIGRRGRLVLDPLSQARAAVDEIDRQAFVFVLVGVGMP